MSTPTPSRPTQDLGTRVVSRKRATLTALPVLLAIGLAVAACFGLKYSALFVFAIYAAPVSFLVWWSHTRETTAATRLEGDALVIASSNGVRRVPLAKIAAAYARLGVVVLDLRDRSVVRISVEDESDAKSLLEALGFDASQRRAEFRHDRAFHVLLAWLLGPVGGALATAILLKTFTFSWIHTPAASLGLFGVLTAALVWGLRPRLDVVIGRDGLLVRGALLRRFIAWSEVSTVTRGDGEFVLRFHGGRTEGFWCNPDDPRVLTAVCARIDEALRMFYSHGASDPIAALDRGGRTLEAWRADLAQLLQPVVGYRTAAVDKTRIVAVLEDPTSSVERRMGAALTLAQSAGDDGRTRVRVAAEVSADPVEREALTRIAEGDVAEATLESALKVKSGR